MDYYKSHFLVCIESLKKYTAQITIFESNLFVKYRILSSFEEQVRGLIHRQKFGKCLYENYLVKVVSVLIRNICMFTLSLHISLKEWHNNSNDNSQHACKLSGDLNTIKDLIAWK